MPIKCTYKDLADLRDRDGVPGPMTKFNNVGDNVSLVDRTRIMKWLKPIIAETAEFEKTHLALLGKYGQRNKDRANLYVIPPEKQAEYQTENGRLEATEVEVASVPLPVESYDGKVPMTVGDLVVLEKFVVMPEAPKTSDFIAATYKDLIPLRDRMVSDGVNARIIVGPLGRCRAVTDPVPLVEKVRIAAFVKAFLPGIAAYEKAYRPIFEAHAERDDKGNVLGNVDSKKTKEFGEANDALEATKLDIAVLPLPVALYDKRIPFSVADLIALEKFIEMPSE